jgi:hypothetical protein
MEYHKINIIRCLDAVSRSNGIVATCKEFYRVVAGDICSDIAREIDIDLDTFYE